MAQVANMEMVRHLASFFQRLEDPPLAVVSTNNISTPPTAAELNSAFGSVSDLPDGFIGAVDDNNAGTTFYIVMTVNGSWIYVGATKAL